MHRRIESHITINFGAYKIYKELERQLKKKNAKITIEIAKNIFEIQVQLEETAEIYKEILILTDEQRY